MPAIDFLCDRADIGLEDIGVVAVDVGPGLFTGMRVGLATAKALAFALRVPMIGISSLDLLAFPHRRSDRLVVPVVDARKGEVFYAMYRPVPGGIQQVMDPRAASVDELVADLLAHSQDALLVGDGAVRYHDRDRGGVPLRARRRGAPERRMAGAARPLACAARGVVAAGGDPAAVPAAARRRDQLDHACRRGGGATSERASLRASEAASRVFGSLVRRQRIAWVAERGAHQ